MGTSQILIGLDRGSAVPLQTQLCDHIVDAVRTGKLQPGDPVPPSRQLAHELDVSRTVVLRAYELLRANGVLDGRRGSGTRISSTLPGGQAPAGSTRTSTLAPEPPVAAPADHPLWQPWQRAADNAVDFRHSTPALAQFPISRWRRSVDEAFTRADAALLGYGPAEGSPALRAQLTALLRRSRALLAPADRILITSGATQAIDILVRLFVKPEDVIVIEDPSHMVLRQIFGYARAAVVAVPVDEQGLRVDDIDRHVRAAGHEPGRVRLIYVTPSHQFPTGCIMSPRRRRDLLRWAVAHGATVLEDDYHHEFTRTGERIPAIAADPGDADVAYVGSFSKTLFPSIRIGYAVLPPHLVQPFLGLKWITDRLTATVTQEALATFISSGSYAWHIGRMDRLYRQRRRRLLDALHGQFGGAVRVSGADAGLHVLATIGGVRGADPAEIARQAQARGVLVHPAADFFLGPAPDDPTFLLGYGAVPAERISEGVAAFAAAVRAVSGPR
ncbi:PLP-dependent aminotransferase family protein [Krasilnikovia sp. MM14-A1259]|uniref:MocR-like pyridoxine biosynthesis transcription factor PdxR n=1 Tax=Krasilnikovia sp. MM14-A1259 TaxID=3373539 RepID=UPI0038081BC8